MCSRLRRRCTSTRSATRPSTRTGRPSRTECSCTTPRSALKTGWAGRHTNWNAPQLQQELGRFEHEARRAGMPEPAINGHNNVTRGPTGTAPTRQSGDAGRGRRGGRPPLGPHSSSVSGSSAVGWGIPSITISSSCVGTCTHRVCTQCLPSRSILSPTSTGSRHVLQRPRGTGLSSRFRY